MDLTDLLIAPTSAEMLDTAINKGCPIYAQGDICLTHHAIPSGPGLIRLVESRKTQYASYNKGYDMGDAEGYHESISTLAVSRTMIVPRSTTV